MCDDFSSTLHRRGFLHAGLTAASAVALGGLVSPAKGQPSRAAETPDQALKLLIEGNTRYVKNATPSRDFSATRLKTATGQSPFASILGCADSRVGPELVFDRKPGDLFVVRVAGNFVTDEGLGSLEFGSAVLGTKLILVLGHTGCGAVKATVEALQQGNQLPGHIAGLVTAMKPGIEETVKKGGSDLVASATVANVRYNVAALQKRSDILSSLVAKNELKITGGVYDLATGKVALV